MDFKTYFSSLLVYDYINLAALVVSFVYLLLGRRSLSYLPLFLLIGNFVEIFLVKYWTTTYRTNAAIYNFFGLFCVAYYFYIYLLHFKNKSWITYYYWALISLSLYTIIQVFMNYHLLDKMIITNYTYNIGMVLTLVLVLTYFYTIISDGLYHSVKRDPLFYFSLGIMLFYFSSFVILNFINYLIMGGNAGNIAQKLLQFGNIFLSLGYLGAALNFQKSSSHSEVAEYSLNKNIRLSNEIKHTDI
ncbi:MAG: hypothetical protein IPN89_05930 [Saprospiraceae bacterium]|nr:hypothetical protein [Saprospiraceae bacterium]